MALEKDLVGRQGSFLAADKVVKGHFIQGGHGGVSGNVPADAAALLVRPDHHGHGVPADDAFYAAFDFAVAGIIGLIFNRDGVYIRSRGNACKSHVPRKTMLLQAGKKIGRALGPAAEMT